MYLFGLILFAVGVGLVGLGVLMLVVRMEKKKGSIILAIGTIIIIVTLIMYTLRPSVAGEEVMIVQQTAVSQHEEGVYRCTVTDAESRLEYHYDSDRIEDAEAFCGKFENGKEYNIKYEYELGKEEYYLLETTEPS